MPEPATPATLVVGRQGNTGISRNCGQTAVVLRRPDWLFQPDRGQIFESVCLNQCLIRRPGPGRVQPNADIFADGISNGLNGGDLFFMELKMPITSIYGLGCLLNDNFRIIVTV
jgi:hypothetical protein